MSSSRRTWITSSIVAVLLFSIIEARTIYDLLDSFRFLNEGQVNSSDVYQYQYEQVLYTEPENATRARFAWAEGPLRPYLYQVDPKVPSECNADTWLNDTDLPGNDLLSMIPSSADPSHCIGLCCSYSACAAWTYDASAPGDFIDCQKGRPCCYLKASVPHSSAYPQLVSAIMNRTVAYLHPPTGMRSSVPLGGITTGSMELRADGTFHEWTIENQSPATGTKYGVVGDALLAFRIKNLRTNESDARLIRTHPNHQLKGISSIRYHGAYPVSKLELVDASLMAHVDLYAYSIMRAGDLNRSTTPAVIFSLNIENTNSDPISVDFMYNAPLSAQTDQNRASNDIIQVDSCNYTECASLCEQNGRCASWTWLMVEDQPTCLLNGDVPYNEYLSGHMSGVRGRWTYDQRGPLTLDRAGNSSSNGQFVLWPFASSNQTASATVDDDVENILLQFSRNGGWPERKRINQSGIHGALSVSTVLKPGETKTLSILFAWYLPHHYWLDLPLDNYYALLYGNASDVGQSVGVDAGDASLASILGDLLTLHNVYLNSSLPDYLVDSLINSPSHMRSAMHFSNGDWRQWEAYDCNDVDSVHNDHQRHLPYILYFPQTEKVKMYAWTKYQQADGMIQEAFTTGCTGDTAPYDEPGGRRMGDVTSIFILETLELYRWTNDTRFLADMYPHVVAGVKWQLSTSTAFGLPEHLDCTYDIPALNVYPTTTFNSFLHLATLRASMELASIMNDTDLYSLCDAPFVLAQKQISQLLWYNDTMTTGYFLAYSGGQGEKAIFADALYGQVLAFTYGLDSLFDISMMRKHLDSEVRLADTPYGLRMLTGREPLTNPQDNSIWMGGSQDWSVLQLWFNEDVDSALIQSEKGLNHVRHTLHDQWNTHGLYGCDEYGLGGKPWVTSHYGFHMVLWHLPFAISGQSLDLPRGILTFAPKVRSPFMLPVLIPNTFGSISAVPMSNGQSTYTFRLSIGSLALNVLSVHHAKYPGSVNLSAGQAVSWIG